MGHAVRQLGMGHVITIYYILYVFDITTISMASQHHKGNDKCSGDVYIGLLSTGNIFVSGCFSFSLISYKPKISQEQKRFLSFCQLSNMASSGLKKILILIIANTRWCHSVGVSFNFLTILIYLIKYIKIVQKIKGHTNTVTPSCVGYYYFWTILIYLIKYIKIVQKIKGHTNTVTPSCVGYYLD